MAETGGPIYEGAGRPEAKPVRGVKDRLTQWMKRTFTMEGREEVQREKILKNFEKTSAQLTPEQKQAAADLLSKNLDSLAHQNAVGSIWRDAIITAVGAPLVGLGIWKRREIGGFIVKHTPEGVKNVVRNAERHVDTAKKTFSGILAETKGKPRERLSLLWAALKRGGLPSMPA